MEAAAFGLELQGLSWSVMRVEGADLTVSAWLSVPPKSRSWNTDPPKLTRRVGGS